MGTLAILLHTSPNSPPSTFTVTFGLPSIRLRLLEDPCRGRRLPQQKNRLRRPIVLCAYRLRRGLLRGNC